MANVQVKRWLSEYKTLTDSGRNAYASTIRQNEELMHELYDLFDDDLSQEVVDPVCHQLFDFYRTLNVELQRFTMELVPVLVWNYLYASSYGDKKKCSGIEACLLGIYNLEVVDENGKPKVKNIKIPTLASSSLFHEPPSLSSLVLTESALSRYHSDVRNVTFGPFPQLESINACNRLPVLTYVINRYNADIANVSTKSHEMLCKICSRLTRTGFESLDDSLATSADHSDVVSNGALHRGVSFVEELRVHLSSGLLVELLSAVHYAIFNGQARLGMQALEDIHWRASYDLYADVLLVTNAVKNSLRSSQLKDVPMGINIALSQGNLAFSKDAITNASFRARILPEDIDVPDAGKSTADVIDEPNDPDPETGNFRASESKSSPGQHKSSSNKGPLKSIMKKREKVQQRKETDMAATSSKRGSHFKELLDLHVSKSPSHSISMSGMSAVNGDASSGLGLGSEARSNRQSVDVDAIRGNPGHRSSAVVVNSDSMDEAFFGRGLAQQQQQQHHHQLRNDPENGIENDPDADPDNDDQADDDMDTITKL